MKVYLDTSVIVRWMLDEPGALKDWGRWEESFTSEITVVEAHRTLDRLRLDGRLDDSEVARGVRLLGEVLNEVDAIGLNQPVLERASRSFPTVVGTLDALHLSSALLYREQRKEGLVFLTHDRRLSIAAQALGFETRG